MKHWTEVELNKLIALFPHMKDKEVADILGRTIQSIRCKARRMDLFKSENLMLKLRQETAQNIAFGEYRHQFDKGADPTIFYSCGVEHPRWIKDRSQVKGPRRRQFRFPPLVMTETRIKQKSRCNICGKLIEHGEFDHIIPVCIGGSSTIDNCQFLCVDCHFDKSRNDQSISNNYLDLDRLQEAYSFIGRNLV